jgi:hypothetical protein
MPAEMERPCLPSYDRDRCRSEVWCLQEGHAGFKRWTIAWESFAFAFGEPRAFLITSLALRGERSVMR